MVEHTFGIGELHELVGRVLRQAFPGEVWVCGEISGLSRSPTAGHRWFKLHDHEPSRPAGSTPGAVLPVVLLDGDRQAVNRVLREHGIGRMDAGMQVRVRGRLEVYRPQGRLQLRMTGVDPTYTLGALEAARDQVLRRLRAEGLADANRLRPLPRLPLRVGLVTSPGSAAHEDFTAVLGASGYAFELVLLAAPMQGVASAPRIARAVHLLAARDVDVVVVVRGGGDRLDLAAFDHEDLARAIATCPVPVLTGIGHQVDRSVADEVAHTAAPTPTAAAALLVERVRGVEDDLTARRLRLGVAASAAVEQGRRRTHERARRAERAVTAALEGHGRAAAARQARLPLVARHALAAPHRRSAQQRALLVDRAAAGLHREEVELGTRRHRTAAVDPAALLERGWAIVRDVDGRLVRDPGAVEVGAALSIRLAGGDLRATAGVVDDPS